jgi:hypothetical protein
MTNINLNFDPFSSAVRNSSPELESSVTEFHELEQFEASPCSIDGHGRLVGTRRERLLVR